MMKYSFNSLFSDCSEKSLKIFNLSYYKKYTFQMCSQQAPHPYKGVNQTVPLNILYVTFLPSDTSLQN